MSNKTEIVYWIKKENIDSYWFVCSKCGEESGFSPITPDYCPHCHRKIKGIMYEDGTIVSRYQALEYWKKRYNQEKNYYDEHWDEEERYQHKIYIDAMKRAIEALENRYYF